MRGSAVVCDRRVVVANPLAHDAMAAQSSRERRMMVERLLFGCERNERMRSGGELLFAANAEDEKDTFVWMCEGDVKLSVLVCRHIPPTTSIHLPTPNQMTPFDFVVVTAFYCHNKLLSETNKLLSETTSLIFCYLRSVFQRGTHFGSFDHSFLYLRMDVFSSMLPTNFQHKEALSLVPANFQHASVIERRTSISSSI